MTRNSLQAQSPLASPGLGLGLGPATRITISGLEQRRRDWRDSDSDDHELESDPDDDSDRGLEASVPLRPGKSRRCAAADLVRVAAATAAGAAGPRRSESSLRHAMRH